jgi:hypothetical protein
MNPEFQGYQQKQDEDHLRLLTLFFRIYGGLSALGALFSIVYIGLGIAMIARPMAFADHNRPAAPPSMSSPNFPAAPPGFDDPPHPPVMDDRGNSPFPSEMTQTRRTNDIPTAGGILLAFGVGIFLIVGAVSVLSFLAANWIRDRIKWTAVIVCSAILCLNIPVGAALGIFTIIVLNRPSVRSLFT